MSTPGRGNGMINQLELNSRAALCRQLARREPNSKVYWLAEAENWLRLSREPIHLERTAGEDPLERFLALMDNRRGP
jgi:hypothetical protein